MQHGMRSLCMRATSGCRLFLAGGDFASLRVLDFRASALECTVAASAEGPAEALLLAQTITADAALVGVNLGHEAHTIADALRERNIPVVFSRSTDRDDDVERALVKALRFH
jgi:CheY-like chemotaxis protein